MTNNIKFKRYKFNKKRFIRFISSIILIISFLISLFYMFKENEKENISSVQVKENSNELKNNMVEFQEEAEFQEITALQDYEEEIIDYDKKPEKLNDAYYEYIVEISNLENIPMEVILAIITTENENYDINASYKNYNGTVDMGLCQINSAYITYFENTYEIENLDPYNVYHAITFVVRHMKYLSNYGKEKYNLSDEDSYIFAAGAYNRGLANECRYRNMYEYKEKFISNYEKFI